MLGIVLGTRRKGKALVGTEEVNRKTPEEEPPSDLRTGMGKVGLTGGA